MKSFKSVAGILIALLSFQLQAQELITTKTVNGPYKLKTGGKVQTQTYESYDAADTAGTTISTTCKCQVDILPPTTSIKTVVKSSAKSSSSKSSAASSTPAVATLIKPTAATASTTQDSNTASLAIDGVKTTRWESKWQLDPQTITLDLGKAYSLGNIEIDWEDSNAESFTIEGSTNNSTWTTLVTFTGGSFGARTDTFVLRGSYRYLKLTGTKRHVENQWGYSIYEIRVMTAGAATSSATPVSSAASSTASSASTTAPTAVKLQWYDPVQRENGETLPCEKIAGYEIYDSAGTVLLTVKDQCKNPLTWSGVLSFPLNDTLKIAAYDTDGLFSKVIPFE